ncbi:hypothetical protein [Streptacidiphilus sp. PAMC 29251]
MMHRRRTHPPRVGRPASAVQALATVLVLLCALGSAAQPAHAASSSTPWPASPPWQGYVEAPSAADVCPVAVQSSSGVVTGAQNLLCGGSGSATLTLTAGGATPTVVLDYGKETGGLPYFAVSAETGSPVLKAGYSEGLPYASANGDGAAPWAEGDPSRNDSYPVSGPGTLTNSQVQGG